MGGLNNAILGVVLVLVAGLVIFVVWPMQTNAADNYLLLYYNSCEYQGERFTQLYTQLDPDTPDYILSSAGAIAVTSGTAGKCAVAETAQATGRYTSWPPEGTPVAAGASQSLISVTEHGVRGPNLAADATDVQANGSITGTSWNKVLALLDQYGTLNKLLISVSTIASVAMFFVIAGGRSFMAYNQGNTGIMGIQMSVLAPILALILIVIQLLVAPFLMENADEAFYWVDQRRLTIWEDWGGIVELVFGFFPVVYNGTLLGWLGLQGYNTYAAFSGRRTFGMGMFG